MPSAHDASSATTEQLADLLAEIRACRACVAAPQGVPLPHEPRPVLRASASARLVIAGQAPGLRVHHSGVPFTDPSGDRLRDWMGIGADIFYNEAKIAIIPMGFCFPGYDAKKSDLPPRKECRALWHDKLFTLMPQVETILLIGGYAQSFHGGRLAASNPNASLPKLTTSVSDMVAQWRAYYALTPRLLPLPHPSWRNSAWLNRNPWFEAEVLPILRAEVARLTSERGEAFAQRP